MSHLFKKFSIFFKGNRSFIIAIKRDRNWPFYGLNICSLNLSPFLWRPILILCHLLFGFPSDLSNLFFLTKQNKTRLSAKLLRTCKAALPLKYYFCCYSFLSGKLRHAGRLIWKLLNPLNAELNPICHLLTLLEVNFLHVSRIRVKSLTLRLLMPYIYGAPILNVSRSHTTTHHSR